MIRRLCLFAPLLYLLLIMASCDSTKKIKYFQDIPDSGLVRQIRAAQYTEPTIRVGDILNVQIQTIDNSSTSLINAGNITSAASSSSTTGSIGAGGSGLSSILSSLSGGNSSQQPVSGYLVDNEGNIELPIIGKLKATGYTIFQLKDTVNKAAAKYYKNAIVIVRYSNFKVNVFGEVLKPGQYIMSDEKVSILDALALAGDLTVFAKRENVLLVRENLDGSKTAYRINLKNSNIMSSPVFYLQQNDFIYVEPRKAKSDATDAAQAKWFGIVGAIMSVLIITATRIK